MDEIFEPVHGENANDESVPINGNDKTLINHRGATNSDSSSSSKNSTKKRPEAEGILGSLNRIELTYYFQVGLIYIVVITAIINLSLSNDEGKLWSSLLSSSIGYLLPHPALPSKRRPE